MKRISLFLLLTVGLELMGARSAAHRFGFLGPEIFPIERGVQGLRAADLDGDGKMDLVVANNLRSRINLLYNRTGEPVKPPVFKAGNVNQLPPDARFRIESITAEKRIASLEVADLNSDGRPDLAYYGMPKELLVVYNGKEGWSKPRRWPGIDGQANPAALQAADVNGDGRTDLVLLGAKQLSVLRQLNDGTLSLPIESTSLSTCTPSMSSSPGASHWNVHSTFSRPSSSTTVRGCSGQYQARLCTSLAS